MKRKIMLGLVAVVTLFLVMAVVRMLLGIGVPKNQPPPKFLEPLVTQTSDYFASSADLPSCGTQKELLTRSPLELHDFTLITPRGLLSPTAHVFPSPHLYFNIRRTDPSREESLPVEVPVIAPADLTITLAKYIEAAGRPDFNDGMVEFGVCKEFKAYFDHLKSFAPTIKAAFDQSTIKHCTEYSLSYPQPIGEVNYNLCEKKIKLTIKKGESIGTAGGGNGQKVFDFGAHDRRVTPTAFAKPERWEGRSHWTNNVCGLDYFPEPLRAQLTERLGGYAQDGRTVKSGYCGEVVQDVIGAASGAWVPPGTNRIEHEPPYLALVHDYIEPQYLVFSIGDSAQSAGLPRGLYAFLPQTAGLVNRHFKDLTADGQTYCFETINRYESRQQPVTIIATLPDAEKLQLQKLDSPRCGPGPWQLTSPAEFIR